MASAQRPPGAAGRSLNRAATRASLDRGLQAV